MLKKLPVNPPTVLRPEFRTASRTSAWSRADGAVIRETTTMRAVLEWAYGKQLARICEGRIGDDRGGTGGGGSSTSVVCRSLETGMVRSGPVARVTSVPVHPDAEWLHGMVKTFDRDEYWLVVRAAESGEPPEWDPYVEPARVVPVLKPNGKPKMIVCPRERRGIACRITVVGHCTEEADSIRAAARVRYAKWFSLLWAMREKLNEERALARWNVTTIGAEPEPWSSGAAGIVATGC